MRGHTGVGHSIIWNIYVGNIACLPALAPPNPHWVHLPPTVLAYYIGCQVEGWFSHPQYFTSLLQHGLGCVSYIDQSIDFKNPFAHLMNNLFCCFKFFLALPPEPLPAAATHWEERLRERQGAGQYGRGWSHLSKGCKRSFFTAL